MAPRNVAVALMIACSLAAFALPARAQVAADGAAGVNVQFDAGTTKTWYIEEQGIGVTYIKEGIDQENPATIAEGLLILDWGFKHEATDGSFPGTGDGTAGDVFHSTSIFVESAARALLELRNYNPVTYTLPKSTYSTVIAQDTHDVLLSAKWLTGATDPNVPVVGQQYDSPYTHRRYILAAGLQETAVLSGDTALTPLADSYIAMGLSMQLTSGWVAALSKDANGVYRVARFVAPGQPLPAGTVLSFSAAGVNPEKYGYDVNYQAYGLEFAESWLTYAGSDTFVAAVKKMLASGLGWEATMVSVAGQVFPSGNSRVGLETAPDGELKTISYPLISDAFFLSEPFVASEFAVPANRVADYGEKINSAPVTADGASGNNGRFERGTLSYWEIGLQMSGSDWIAAGVACDNPAYIQKGLLIFNWGWARQSSNGSFSASSDQYFGTVQFVEAAARSTLLLKKFNAVAYASTIATYTTGIKSATAWLTGTSAKVVAQNLSHSVSDEYAAAACLAESAALTGNATLAVDAIPYADAGLAMQLPSGENPESGAADPDWQAISVQYAEWYYPYCTNTTLRSSLSKMIVDALDWEMPYISITGTLDGSAPIRSVGFAFSTGASITGLREYQVVDNRIEND